jgi:hypothetical protein
MALTLLLLLFLLAAVSPAQAFRLPADLGPVAGNPADRMPASTLDPVRYDPARRCLNIRRPGVDMMVRWLERQGAGVFWGSYRCETWGPRSASLHAENRAVDWHLNAYDRASARAARALIELLLAPGKNGEPTVLARRMGVQELIWDCSYWGAGMAQFQRYSPCFGKTGRPRRHVDKTIAHRDHIHIGMTKPGSMGRTSFWR